MYLTKPLQFANDVQEILVFSSVYSANHSGYHPDYLDGKCNNYGKQFGCGAAFSIRAEKAATYNVYRYVLRCGITSVLIQDSVYCYNSSEEALQAGVEFLKRYVSHFVTL